jgi:hypothetical protein
MRRRSVGDAATKYNLTDAEAELVAALALIPADVRVDLLRRHADKHGAEAVLRLFAQVVGAANSVIANCREMAELHAVVSGIIHPERAHQLNMPTLAGAMAGVKLANTVKPKSLCEGCAYRLGTPANQSPPTVEDAGWSVDCNEDFLCHVRVDELERPSQVCAGHAQAVRRVSSR